MEDGCGDCCGQISYSAREPQEGLEQVSLPPSPCSSPKEVGDVIALSDITPSGAADHSQEPSPVGSRRGRVTPNLSRASSDADHGVSKRVLVGRDRKAGAESGRGSK
jgi:hypothetical protein